nr:sporulation protein YqfC [Clostridia bacterium]
MHGDIFPREVTSNVPCVTLTGRDQLHVEQHEGLVDYEPENIVLRTAVGLMRIGGAGMVFRMYNAQEAVIVGRIDSVVFGTEAQG